MSFICIHGKSGGQVEQCLHWINSIWTGNLIADASDVIGMHMHDVIFPRESSKDFPKSSLWLLSLITNLFRSFFGVLYYLLEQLLCWLKRLELCFKRNFYHSQKSSMKFLCSAHRRSSLAPGTKTFQRIHRQ